MTSLKRLDIIIAVSKREAFMRKFKKIVCMFLWGVALVCSSLFFACEQQSESVESIEGIYYFKSLRCEGIGASIELVAGENYQGVILSEDFIVLTLRENGFANVVVSTFGEDAELTSGRWWKIEDEGNKICLSLDDDPIDAEYNGKSLVIADEDEGANYILTLEKK